MKRHVAVLASLFGLMQMPAHAADLVLDVGYATGGDELASAELYNEYTDDSFTDHIDAGAGISFGIGVNSSTDDLFAFQATANYKVDGIFASNADATFSRFPLNAAVFIQGDIVRIGFGVTNELNPTLDASEIDGGSVQFRDAIGTIVDIGFKLGKLVVLSLQFTDIEYESEENYFYGYRSYDGGNTVQEVYEPIKADGSNIGLHVSFNF